MASNLTKSDGIQPNSDGLLPDSDGLQPDCNNAEKNRIVILCMRCSCSKDLPDDLGCAWHDHLGGLPRFNMKHRRKYY